MAATGGGCSFGSWEKGRSGKGRVFALVFVTNFVLFAEVCKRGEGANASMKRAYIGVCRHGWIWSREFLKPYPGFSLQ